jgi:alanine racemase
LGAIRRNMALVRAKTKRQAKVLATVKANAYGHGALEVAKACLA